MAAPRTPIHRTKNLTALICTGFCSFVVFVSNLRGGTKPSTYHFGATAEQIIHERPQQQGRIMSVCAGSLILARLGLLAGKKATTNHDLVGELEGFTGVEVVRDVLYTCDGAIHTSAGISRGIDLALHLVALEAGPALAAQVARMMVTTGATTFCKS